jgi:hypothetical protein
MRFIIILFMVTLFFTPVYANDCGYINTDTIRENLKAGNLYPELMEEIIITLSDYYDCMHEPDKTKPDKTDDESCKEIHDSFDYNSSPWIRELGKSLLRGLNCKRKKIA